MDTITGIKLKMDVINRRVKSNVMDVANLLDDSLNMGIIVVDSENDELINKLFTFNELERAHLIEISKGYGGYSKTWVKFTHADVITLMRSYWGDVNNESITRFDLGMELDSEYYNRTLTGSFMYILNNAVNDLINIEDENLIETIKEIVNRIHKKV